MRITNQLFFSNSKNNYQSSMKGLYTTNQQLGGLKIQHSFQDSGIYVDAMRLEYEAKTLAQVKTTSAKAQTFADNTDKALSQMVESLEKFKVLAVQASSDANSVTSLNAIANEMEGILTHIKDVANTSINGIYLFSGTATDIKPITEEGKYQGNGGQIEAVVGSNSKLSYNIDGLDLFLGTNNDYAQTLSTNIPLYNQSKLRPQTMVEGSGVTEGKEVYLTSSDTIRDMIGDVDTLSGNDPRAVFYVSGRNSIGDTFSEKIAIDTSSSIADLLEQIGFAYGNNKTSKVVDVSMNDYGQIEIKDLKSGSLKMEMNLFGAIDRSATFGTAGAADALNIGDLYGNSNVQIIEFNKSNHSSNRAVSQVGSSQKINAPGEFTLGAPLFDSKQNPALPSTLLHDVLGSEVSEIRFAGLDNTGAPLAPLVLAVNGATTVQDLLSHVETEFNVSASIGEDGQITLKTGGTNFSDNEFRMTMQAIDVSDAQKIQMLEFNTQATADGTIAVTFNFGPTVTAVIDEGDTQEQIAKKIADQITALAPPEISSVEARNGRLYIQYNTGDNTPDAAITANSTGATALPVNTTRNFSDTRLVNAFSIHDGSDAFFKSFEKDGNTLLSNVPQVNKKTNQYATDSTKLIDIAGVDSLDGRKLAFDFTNLKGEKSKGEIFLKDEGSEFYIDFDGDGHYSPEETFPLFNGEGDYTSANDVTYRQIMDVLGLAMTDSSIADTPPSDGDLFPEFQEAVKNMRRRVEVELDHRGRISIKDKTTSQTSLELSLYDTKSTSFSGLPNESAALSFMANSSTKIVDPSNDIFVMLEEIIEDVRGGNMRLGDNEGNPKSIGIQHSLDRLDKLNDHVVRMQTKAGSLSSALQDSHSRATLLEVNVKTVKSEIIDADYGETMMQFQQYSLAYQAMLSTVSKINQLSLVNYM